MNSSQRIITQLDFMALNIDCSNYQSMLTIGLCYRQITPQYKLVNKKNKNKNKNVPGELFISNFNNFNFNFHLDKDMNFFYKNPPYYEWVIYKGI